ncbi:MAG TPA: hypothetical protein VFR90_06535 [Methylibium sp.]|uniref:hypothetical protein n=1 Tax=Methylibium sp. TaxID=2067992 RepID=UPI002DBF0199|nr:hypothetical protein [Methylibium sp.]HEU4458762.1 hypothetical protein [Methylibium sp.]
MPFDAYERVAAALQGPDLAQLARTGKSHALWLGPDLQAGRLMRAVGQIDTAAAFEALLGSNATSGMAANTVLATEGRHRLQTLSGLIGRIPALPEADRPRAFTASLEAASSIPPAQQSSVLHELVAAAGSLPAAALAATAQALLPRIASQADPEFRQSHLTALFGRVGEWPMQQRQAGIEAGLAAIAQLPQMRRAAPLNALLASATQPDAQPTAATFRAFVAAIATLAHNDRGLLLEVLLRHMGALPPSEEGGGARRLGASRSDARDSPGDCSAGRSRTRPVVERCVAGCRTPCHAHPRAGCVVRLTG